MKLEPFRPQHTSILAEWLHLHKCPEQAIDDIPAYGLVAFEGTEPVAAGFVRRGEGFCLLDGYISNPKISAELRNKALNDLTDHLVAAAKAMEFKRILCFSQNLDIIRRAKGHGFEYLDYSILGKAI